MVPRSNLLPILIDAARHGFERSENLLKMMFSVPYIGVTIVALAAALLLGWAAAIRFGPPMREERAIALGKQALADNSAGLVAMARREAIQTNEWARRTDEAIEELRAFIAGAPQPSPTPPRRPALPTATPRTVRPAG